MLVIVNTVYSFDDLFISLLLLRGIFNGYIILACKLFSLSSISKLFHHILASIVVRHAVLKLTFPDGNLPILFF